MTLGLRRWKENHPLIARHGRSAAAGIARLVQLCTSMGASHVVNEAGEAMDTACETDRLAESSIREALLDACRHDAKMMRRIQNADRKRGSGISGGAGSSGEESPAGFDAATLDAEREEALGQAAACGASSRAAPPRERKREEPALSHPRPPPLAGFGAITHCGPQGVGGHGAGVAAK